MPCTSASRDAELHDAQTAARGACTPRSCMKRERHVTKSLLRPRGSAARRAPALSQRLPVKGWVGRAVAASRAR
eukprot:9468505-Pyramimonas_sp.AAC.1